MYRVTKLFLLFIFPAILNAQTDWEVNPNYFEHSMTITCVVQDIFGNPSQENFTVGAFDGDQCVGVVNTSTYFALIDANLAFLVIYGNSPTATYSLKVLVNKKREIIVRIISQRLIPP